MASITTDHHADLSDLTSRAVAVRKERRLLMLSLLVLSAYMLGLERVFTSVTFVGRTWNGVFQFICCILLRHERPLRLA